MDSTARFLPIDETPRQDAADRIPPAGWVVLAALAAAASYLLARYVALGPAPGPWAYWPVHGILVGILLRRPPREWVGIGAAAAGAQVLAVYLVRGDLAGGATPAGALVGLVQAGLSAAILRHGRPGGFRLDGPRDLGWFTVVAVMLVPLAIAPLSALIYAWGLGLPYAAVWAPLYAGNSLSVLVFAPPLVRWRSAAGHPSVWSARPLEALLCKTGILALTLVTFAGHEPWMHYVALPYTLFPLLAWSALRCGPRWTAVAVASVATIAAWCTARGLGPFGGLPVGLDQRVVGLQAYLAFVAFTGLVLSALTAERLTAGAELSLRDSIQRAFFESTQQVLTLSDLEGRLVLLNQAAQEVFGGPGAAATGRHPRELLASDDAAAIERHDRRVRDRGEPLTFEETLPLRNERRRLVVTRFPVRDQTGAIRYIGMIGRDDSLERELTRHLQGAQRVEILGRLAAGIAHDLNNLLTVVVGYTRLLEDGVRSREDEEILGEMGHAGDEAVRLTGRLMALGRNRGAPVEAVHADTVVRELGPLLKVLARGNVDLDTRLDAPGVEVAADPTAIEQIVLNLVSNARDAITGDGTVTLTTQAVSRGGRRWLRLAVADTGMGMEPAVLDRIFEPFFTTKTETMGTGLGLYTVAAIVRQAGGEITARSEPGAGSVFVVELPAVEPPEDE